MAARPASVGAALKSVPAVCLLVVLTSATFVLLWLRHLGASYGRKVSEGFAAKVRALLPRRRWRFILPALCLYPLSAEPLGLDLSTATSPFMVAMSILWILVGFLLVEVFLVHVRRESWIAAYEPWWVVGYEPFEARSVGRENERLHHLLRICAWCTVPLVILGATTHVGGPVEVSVLSTAFFVKFVAHANFDFEAIVHWDMHCQVLDDQHSRRRTLTRRLAMEWMVGPLCGYIPLVYASHHLLIHHVKNGGPDDIHSTLGYKRTDLVDFGLFAFKVILSTAFGVGVVTHRRCTGARRYALLFAMSSFWIVTAVLANAGLLLGYWLVLAVVIHGLDVARNQYTWHGLSNRQSGWSLHTSTVSWVTGATYRIIVDDSLTEEQRARALETRSSEAGDYPGLAPDPSMQWAFYDNLHRVHHLHSSAHFASYPLLAAGDEALARTDGHFIMNLEGILDFPEACLSGDISAIQSAVLWPAQDPEATRQLIDEALQQDLRYRPGTLALADKSRSLRLMHTSLRGLLPRAR